MRASTFTKHLQKRRLPSDNAGMPTPYVPRLICGILGVFYAVQVVLAVGEPRIADDHVIVRFKNGIEDQLRNAAIPLSSLTELATQLGLPAGTRLEEPAMIRMARQKGREADGAASFGNFLYVWLPPQLTVEHCIQMLRSHPWVEYAEADGLGDGGFFPNDPYFLSQWHHRNTVKPSAAIQTPAAWDITQGSTNVIVAVLDSGLQTDLIEFSGRILPGYNFASNTLDVTDDHGHGTAVTGTLCATGNNATLVAGVDWRCRILPVKVLGYDNSGLYSWWAQGIDFAVDKGAKIINLSAGGWGASETLTRAITNAIAKGSIFVTITHNDGAGAIRFPGNLGLAITVGATDSQDRRCHFSNYGQQIDLVAPGTNIYTVGRGGGKNWSGTSFSAPHVAGVCALIAGMIPDVSPGQARTLLVAGSDDQVGDLYDTQGFDNYYGWGRLNALNSLILAQTRVSAVTITNRNDLRLCWKSPVNASIKHPFIVERSSSLSGPWTPYTNSNGFAYTSTQTTWIDIGALTNDAVRYYRIRIVDFQ